VIYSLKYPYRTDVVEADNRGVMGMRSVVVEVVDWIEQ